MYIKSLLIVLFTYYTKNKLIFSTINFMGVLKYKLDTWLQKFDYISCKPELSDGYF